MLRTSCIIGPTCRDPLSHHAKEVTHTHTHKWPHLVGCIHEMPNSRASRLLRHLAQYHHIAKTHCAKCVTPGTLTTNALQSNWSRRNCWVASQSGRPPNQRKQAATQKLQRYANTNRSTVSAKWLKGASSQCNRVLSMQHLTLCFRLTYHTRRCSDHSVSVCQASRAFPYQRARRHPLVSGRSLVQRVRGNRECHTCATPLTPAGLAGTR